MVPPVAQSDNLLCGPAATVSVLLYNNISLDSIRESLKTQPSTAKWRAADIVALARSVGLEAYSYQGSLDNAFVNVAKGRPVVILLRGPPRTGRYPSFSWFEETTHMITAKAHWVVLVGWTNDHDVVLLDPLQGYLVMQRKDIRKDWNYMDYVCVVMAPHSKEARKSKGSP